MKNYKKWLSFFMLVSFFTFISCEKSETVDDSIDVQSVDIERIAEMDLTGMEPAAVSETREIGKKIEDIRALGESTLTTASDWDQITKNEVRAVGISDSQVYGVVFNEYYSGGSLFGGYPFRVESVSIGPNESYGTNRWHVYSSSAQLPEYRFYGQGSVTQQTGFAPWKRVSSVNAQVHTNYLEEGQIMGGDLWITTGTTITNEYSVEASATVSATKTMKVPLFAEAEVTVEVSLGASYTRSNEKSFSENFYFPYVYVPEGYSVRYQLEERHVPVETNWKFPIQFRGNYVNLVEISYEYGGSGYGVVKENVSAFNDNYDQPGMYHTMIIDEQLSKEFRVAAYLIPPF